MSIGIIIVFTALITSIGEYIDKKIVTEGISRHDYFYYMCMTMIPFAIAMCFIEQVKFEFSIIPIILLILAMILRYIKQHAIVGCLEYLNPHETSTYMSLTVVVAFIIDGIMGMESFNLIHMSAVILTIVGVFIFTDVKLQIKSLQKDLIIRILANVAIGYITYFILKYWSNAIYILLLNLSLTFIFAPQYKLSYHKKQSKIIKLSFIQQIFGFFAVYFQNILASKAVTYSQFIKPTALVFSTILSFFIKGIKRKPTFKDIIGIMMVVLGVILINT